MFLVFVGGFILFCINLCFFCTLAFRFCSSFFRVRLFVVVYLRCLDGFFCEFTLFFYSGLLGLVVAVFVVRV